ncbi:MAG: hypothetical protein ACXWPM_13260, partial [Bdellovibrionota bacterium]
MSGLKARLNWRWLIALSLVAGFLLRVLLVQDMEFKEDEEYHFYQTQLAALGLPWPWVGIASGVYILNPGMSVWVFNALSGAFHLHTPTALCLGVRLFAFAGVAMILPFVRRAIPEKERAPWFWAMALAMVNPFLILYERKLWPEPFLPAFTLLTLLGWFRRRDFAWAFVWGLIGACLGQIHMSGFFFALALAGWTLLFSREKVNWKGWLLGSVLGALPLFPWLAASLGHPSSGTVGAGLSELLQFKFWAFWITDPLGLTLGNPLGIARGNSVLVQIADFLRYPLIGGTPTYLVCVAHLAALASGAWILARGTRT